MAPHLGIEHGLLQREDRRGVLLHEAHSVRNELGHGILKGLGLDALDVVPPTLADAVDQREQDCAFAAEVVVECAFRDAGLGGNLARGRPVVAAPVEDAFGRVEDLGGSLGGSAPARPGFGLVHAVGSIHPTGASERIPCY